MDTKPLERFAAQARRDLLAAVEAQASAVLAVGSVARSERGETVKRLEAEIAKHGLKHVIDKVAYTWFNRLIALRYMDVHGYTTAGVVSPAQGHEHGQPEILADAKGGHLDTDIVTSARTQEAITGLLDGTRRSTDAEGEAYALLLTEYCRRWNKAMSFMFDREGDYTELLVPAGLLADGGMLCRARAVLTKDVCEDVEVIGWLYQFYISERKDEVFAGFKQNKKAGADEIPAATQLFTPHWIVRYLVENSLGRLWMLNRPASRLFEKMDYYIAPVDEETDFLKVSGAEELTVMDPACGSGHMLTYAFDLLYAIYEEEGYAPAEIPSLILTHNLQGTEIDPRAGALAAFALTMKARAKDRRLFKKDVEPRICVIEPISFSPDELDFLNTKAGDHHTDKVFWNQFRRADILGALIKPQAEATKRAGDALEMLKNHEEMLYAGALDRARRVICQAEVLSRKYAVVTANPPYMGVGAANPILAEYLANSYTVGKSSLDAAFILRGLEFVVPNGFCAMITMQAWMFKTTYLGLRELILQRGIATLALLGSHAFENQSGQVVSTSAFVIGTMTKSDRGVYLALSDRPSSELKRVSALQAIAGQDESIIYESAVEDFYKIPGTPVSFWVDPRQRALYESGHVLAKYGSAKKGMDTGNHDRFLRRWSEVSRSRISDHTNVADKQGHPTRTWVPYNKGGAARRWYGNREFVVNWGNAGAEIKSQKTAPQGRSSIRNESFYFKAGFTYNEAGFGEFAARFTPDDSVFDSVGATVFAAEYLDQIGAFLNTRVAALFFDFLCNGNHYQPGAVERLLVLPEILESSISAAACVDVVKADWDAYEQSIEFSANPLITKGRSAIEVALNDVFETSTADATLLAAMETANNEVAIDLYGLQDLVSSKVTPEQVTLTNNPFRELDGQPFISAAIADLVSYAVGCMFGRYSLDEPGLIIADHGVTLQDYLAKVPSPNFMPDADNVIPFVDDGWFEDDIVERFRQFLRAAFGAEHFEENLRFVEESLGVKTIRDYFIAKSNLSGKTVAKSRFYEDHVQRYKKRPIYWMFSSPKGSFNALIYMHRYTPSTVSTVLNEYLREYRAKLEIALQRAEEAAAGGVSTKEQKESDRLRKVLAELRDYEHDVLYPLDIQKMDIDLDDGVLVNYLRFGPALRDFGLEKDRAKVESWTWPKNRMEPSK
ncbi:MULTISPECIES: BREX-1 system adenine-specific DNA-methyltransferase PglX [unclassified Pseudarthrobacter]|uniref:BREX-1 system adenine-specific DNA-methyltransferase PglX n=1 Tax=unclassified Pseudarthrobacter TaxID=2647000 RepID=UPI00363AB504